MTEVGEYWETKRLDELTSAEWESLCDGCALCCLEKLQDAETEEVFYTDVVCSLLDTSSCRCKDYPNRAERVPECIQLSLEHVEAFRWLPRSCAYRLRAANQPLPDWHPLKTGSADSVHESGVSIRNRPTCSKRQSMDMQEHVIDWGLL